MALTAKEIYDLNNMNVAAQKVQLGTVLDKLIEGGGVAALDWENLDEDTRRMLMAMVEQKESVEL